MIDHEEWWLVVEIEKMVRVDQRESCRGKAGDNQCTGGANTGAATKEPLFYGEGKDLLPSRAEVCTSLDQNSNGSRLLMVKARTCCVHEAESSAPRR